MYMYTNLQFISEKIQGVQNLKGEASPSIYADWVNGGWFYKPNSKSLGKFG